MKSLMTKTHLIGILFIVFSCNQKAADTSEQKASPVQTVSKSGQAFVEDDMSAKNILQIAISSPDHTTLVAGVQAAELENILVNPGPLTVFAPSNAGFD